MKKLLIFFLFPITLKGQDSTLSKKDTVPGITTYFQFQYQRNYDAGEFSNEYPWFWLSVGKKAGVFVFASKETGGVTGVSVGPYFSFGKKVYNEIGVGIGLEFPGSSYTWGYYYFENKPDYRLAENKIIFQTQYAYSADWGHWTMISATLTPFQKYFGIGFWQQTETSWGGKVVGNIPLGKNIVLSSWLGGGIDKKLTWGTDLIFQFQGKEKIKNRK